MMSDIHNMHIDLNASPLLNNDEQQFENHVNHMQEVPASHSINQDVMHTFDLNVSPLINNDEQSLLDSIGYVQQSSKSHISNTISSKIMDGPIVREESMKFINVSSFGKTQQKTRVNNQADVHKFDLNSLPLPNNDEESSEDFIDDVQRSAISLPVSHEGLCKIMDVTNVREDSKKFTNVSSSEKIQQKIKSWIQADVHKFDLNSIPSSNDDEESFEDFIDYVQESTISMLVSHEVPCEIMDGPIVREEPMIFTNFSSSEKIQQKTLSDNQAVVHNFNLNSLPSPDNDEKSFEDCTDYYVRRSAISMSISHEMPHELVIEDRIIEEQFSSVHTLWGAFNPLTLSNSRDDFSSTLAPLDTPFSSLSSIADEKIVLVLIQKLLPELMLLPELICVY